MLEIKDLSTDIITGTAHARAVRHFDFMAGEGIITGIVGESGSGKSIAMKSALRILPQGGRIVSGSIALDGKRIDTLAEREMRHMRGSLMAMIFQDPMTALNPVKNIGGHLTDCIRRHRRTSRKEALQQAANVLADVGISSPDERMRQYPHEFSGGMRQRIMIAMALLLKPRLLIADEPTTALDVTTQAQILDLIQGIQRGQGMSVVLITHDLGVVARLCDRVTVMYGGMAMEEGSAEDIFYRPRCPYTQALLLTLPRIDGEAKTRLKAIRGTPYGSASDAPEEEAGCPFCPRCDEAFGMCKKAIPPMTSVGDGHSARCFLNGGGI